MTTPGFDTRPFDLTTESLWDLLSLAMLRPPSLAELEEWSDEERDAAALWAGSEHAYANHYPEAPRPNRLGPPEHLVPFLAASRAAYRLGSGPAPARP